MDFQGPSSGVGQPARPLDSGKGSEAQPTTPCRVLFGAEADVLGPKGLSVQNPMAAQRVPADDPTPPIPAHRRAPPTVVFLTHTVPFPDFVALVQVDGPRAPVTSYSPS